MTVTATPRIGYRQLRVAQVTQLVVDDLNELLPQLKSAPSTLTAQDVVDILNHGTIIFVATHDARIVGTVLLCSTRILVGRKDWIEDVVVHEGYRRLGIAKHLMEMAHQQSRAHGATSINLTSGPERKNAREMYQDMGYEPKDTTVFRRKP